MPSETSNQSPRTPQLLRQLVLPLVILGLLSTLVEAAVSMRLIQRSTEQQIRTHAQVLLAAAEHQVHTTSHVNEIRRFFTFLNSDPSIVHLSLIDAESRTVVAGTRYGWIERSVDDPQIDLSSESLDLVEGRLHVREISDDHWEFSRRFRSDPHGTSSGRVNVLVLKIDVRSARQAAWSGLLQSLPVLLSGTFLMLLAVILLLRRTVLNPLREIFLKVEKWRNWDPYDGPESDTEELEIVSIQNEVTELGLELAAALTEVAGNEKDLADLVTELRQANEDLDAARAEAEAANSAKDEFLANMSHEIRTPMNGVLGMAERLLQSDLPETQRQQAEIIAVSAKALLQVINDILDLSRIEAGKLRLQFADLSIRELIGEVVEMLRLSAQVKNITLCSQLRSLPENLYTDPVRLRQILTNLAGNAIKFTDEGEVCIHASIASGERETGTARLLIEIRDTGIGISEEDLSRLFQPFEQIDPSAQRRYGGSGLGLAICKQLVELLGGSIDVESEVESGSVFRVEIPVVVRDRPSTESTTMTFETPIVADIESRARFRVLVVEDDEINRLVASACLAEIGYAADFSENGAEALERLQEVRYDLILMDCHMPGLDGYETTRRLRAGPEPESSVPVVALTAAALDRDRRRCLEAGMSAILNKPYTTQELADMIDRFLLSSSP